MDDSLHAWFCAGTFQRLWQEFFSLVVGCRVSLLHPFLCLSFDATMGWKKKHSNRV